MKSTMTTPVEITVQLMQQILREAKKDGTIVVLPNLEVQEMNETLHVGSCLRRVTVKYTRLDQTTQHSLSLIVKVEPQNTSHAEMVKQSTFFVREIQMFNEILPRMSVLLSRALPDSHTDFSARVYYTRKTPSYLIAIEDLSQKGFKAPKRKNGLDLKHSILTLRTLARFHASSVMIRREDENLLEVFNKNAFEDGGFNEGMAMIIGMLVPFVTQVIESWPDFGRSWADRVQQRFQTLYVDLQNVNKRDDSAFNVLNHADFGIQNVMYRYSETSEELEGVMLVDFQCCSYNSPVLDLHQFIFASANNEVRDRHIDTLLTEYHAELTTTLEALGAPQDMIISLPELHKEFNGKMVLGFVATTFALPLLNLDLDNFPGMSAGDLFNVSNGIDKLQSLLSESYFVNLRNMLPLFSKNKVI